MTSPDTLIPIVASLCGGAVALFVFSLLLWTARDISSRTHDPFIRLAAVFLVVALNVFGVIVYVLLRPPETLADRQEREMIEELLARDAMVGAVRRNVEGQTSRPT